MAAARISEVWGSVLGVAQAGFRRRRGRIRKEVSRHRPRQRSGPAVGKDELIPNTASSSRRPPVLMVVHAHPDDEASQTGGTLARYAAAGWRTVLITCTDGGQGDGPDGVKPGDPHHDPRQVAALRSRELDLAAAALGVHDLVKLGYPDSGIPDGNAIPPRADVFSRRPLAPMVTRLVRLLRHYQPDVVVTYPSNGLSGHPDHIRTHELVRAALRTIAAEPAGQGLSTRTVIKLYYIAMSKSRLRAVRAGARAAFGEDAWMPPEEMAIDDSEITTVIDVAPYSDNKVRALSAHASQSDATAVLQMLCAADTLADFGERVEEYVRAEGYTGFVEDGFARTGGKPL
ncbi:MAG: PIG-L family deacetylase [Mycobacterium sp.]|uniref:PIG-L deacetylase family protein n=1 Tax=Mycobacterium sp. TaxID=1785 RepID=UPI003C6654A1